MDVTSISKNCTRTEFVGTAVLDTIGLVISGADEQLLRQMGLGMKYRSLGVYSSRTGAAGQLTALDEAVKSTNTEILSVELPRDTKGWGGHGNYAVIGGDTPSDVRKAIEIALSQGNCISARRGIWNSPILRVRARCSKRRSAQNSGRRSAFWRARPRPSGW